MDEVIEVMRAPGILPMLAYALGLYVLTSSVVVVAGMVGGRADKMVRHLRSVIPVVIGALTAPAVVPYMLEGLGAADAPIGVAVFVGITAGGLSKVIWDLLNKVIMRRFDGGGRDEEV